MSNTTPAQGNPHHRNVDRAPYELGFLLKSLPAGFNGFQRATPDTLQIADSAARHAYIASSTVLCGIEAIGACLSSAIIGADVPIEAAHVRGLAELIQHLAVEAQFLQETHVELGDALRRHAERFGAGESGKVG